MNEICEINYKDAVFKISTNKQKLKQKEYLQEGKIPVIDQGQEVIGGYTNDEDKILDCKLPIIVFGDHTKKVKLINFPFAPGADGTKVLQPKKGILHKYLSYVTEVLVFKIKDNGYARHYQHIEKENFPLVSVPEQKAIVTKIEALFSSLDSGIADFKKAQEQLVIYRQAVLKKAFEGEADSIKLIKDVVVKVQIGPFGSQLHQADYITDGIPLINPMHIQEGSIKPNTNYTISIEKRDSLPNYILQEGDVVMGRRGEMGRSALVTKKEIGWFCGTGSLYLRANLSLISPGYLNKYIQSAKVKELLTGSATGTTMMNLNKKIINNLPIPIPSIQEQQQIVQEIESRLSVCDKVEESITESLGKAQALRQSILKKAFEGTLLSEEEVAKCRAHPDYEPAYKLLEKIRAEKK